MKKSNNNDNEDNNDNKNNSDNNNTRSDSSIFYIMDGIIDQLNKTKKLFIIMLLTIMIIPPIAFMLTFLLFGFAFGVVGVIIGGGIVDWGVVCWWGCCFFGGRGEREMVLEWMLWWELVEGLWL